MIEVMLFDFGQTLVDSSEGFRAAERDAQSKIFAECNGWLMGDSVCTVESELSHLYAAVTPLR